MINICIVTNWFPSTAYPQIAPFSYHLSKNLSNSNLSISVITTFREKDEYVQSDGNLVIYRVKGPFPLLDVFRLLRKINPDVIHVLGPNFFSSTAIIVARLINKPIIATVYRAELDSVSTPLSFCRKIALRRYKAVIACSKFAKKLAIRAGVPEEKIALIHNSCNESIFFPKEKSVVRNRLSIPADRNVILFVGNLVRTKGIFTLIESFKILRDKIPEFVSFIVGRGDEQENLEKLVRQYKLDERVRLVGWRDETELAEFYNAADVLVLPSVVEGQSVAILEAMACGLPIVASRIEGNEESIIDGVNGFLFRLGDEKDLAEKIKQVLTDGEIKRKMSSANIKAYSENFNETNQKQRYLEIYKTAVNKKSNKLDLTNAKPTVLLIDNHGLSFYTTYLADGLSKYCDIILYGLSRTEYYITGASKNSRIEFFHMGGLLPQTSSLFSKLVTRPLLVFVILLKAFLKSKHYDIVHIQGHLALFFLLIPLLKIKGHKQIVWTLHDVKLRPSSKGLRGKLELIYIRVTTQPAYIARQAQKIIVHGLLLKETLVKEGIDPRKIFVIPIFDFDYLLKVQNTSEYVVDSTNKVPELDGVGDRYVLFFGRIAPYKGIDTLIAASRIARQKLESRSRLQVVIVGSGDTTYIKKLIRDTDEDFIHIVNRFIHHFEIPFLMSRTKFMVLPYVEGSQSAVLSLAYTFSKAVLVSDAGSLQEYVDNGKTGMIFQAGNTNQLGEYIAQLILDDHKCIEMGKNARIKLLREMTLDKCSRDIYGIYKRHKPSG